jgi:general stress protein 26
MSRDETTDKIWSLIKDARVAMLTSDDDGVLRSRPMVAAQDEFDGTLWFFTRLDSPKVDEVRQDPQVNVAYASASDNSFVSLSGVATVSQDRDQIDKRWNAGAKAWFPKGKDDPEVALLKVSVAHAEYWDAPSSKMVVAWAYLKSRVTGKQPGDVGDHAKVDL